MKLETPMPVLGGMIDFRIHGVAVWDALFFEAMSKTGDVRKRSRLVQAWIRHTADCREVNFERLAESRGFDAMKWEFESILCD